VSVAQGPRIVGFIRPIFVFFPAHDDSGPAFPSLQMNRTGLAQFDGLGYVFPKFDLFLYSWIQDICQSFSLRLLRKRALGPPTFRSEGRRSPPTFPASTGSWSDSLSNAALSSRFTRPMIFFFSLFFLIGSASWTKSCWSNFFFSKFEESG